MVIKNIVGNSLVSGSLIYLISNVINAAIPFALLPILTRYLTPAEYGEWAIFQTLLGAFCSIVGVNAAGAANRKYYDHIGDSDLKDFVAASLQVLVVSGMVVLVCVYLSRVALSDLLSIDVQWILWAVFVSILSVVVNIRLGQWQVRGNALRYGLFQISKNIVNLIASVSLVVVFSLGVGGAIYAQVLSIAAFSLIGLILLSYDSMLGFFSWRPLYIKEVIFFGVPLIPHMAGGFLLTSVDRFVIGSELGMAEAGIYMVAVQLSRVFVIVFESINNAYVPWLFERLKRNDAGEKNKIVRYTYLWFIIIIFGVVLVSLTGSSMVTYIAGDQYARAGDLFGWLVLGQAFGGMYLMVTNYIFFSKRTGLLSMVTIASGIVNVCLVVIFIRVYGLVGAAVAFSLAMGIRFILTWWVAQNRYPMPWFVTNKG